MMRRVLAALLSWGGTALVCALLWALATLFVHEERDPCFGKPPEMVLYCR